MFARLTNLIGWLGVALVFAGFAFRMLKPQMVPVWRNLAAAGLVCVLIYIAGQWRDILAFFTRRQTRYGAFSVASVLIVLGILTGVNYIAARQHKRWDLTASKQFSLSDQTRKVLQNLKAPLTMRVFTQEVNFAAFRDQLGEYEYLSKQVKIEYIDPDKEPALAKQYEIRAYNTVAVEYEQRIERVTGLTEQDLTNAIVKAVEGQQKKVYFVQGHGEKDTGSADERAGYNTAASALSRENFTVEKLPLAQQPEVPADAAVVVIAGPTTDYIEPEIAALRAYLNKGGKLLLMLDPRDTADAAPLTNLIALAKEWGIDVHDDVVVDRVGQIMGQGSLTPIAMGYPGHAITERFDVMTGFPMARSVTPDAAAPAGRTAQSIVETSPQSWSFTDLKIIFDRQPLKIDEARDKKGPISLAAAVAAPSPEQPADAAKPDATNGSGSTPPAEPAKRETRLVVFGDSDFVSNNGLNVAGNVDLFLNSVNWLAQQENLIAIRPKAPDDRRLTMTRDDLWMFFLFAVVLLPGMVVVAGVYTWWRRR